MKKITLLFIVLVFTFSARAQFPEGFETSVPPAGWTSFVGGNGLGTTYDCTESAAAASGSKAAFVRYENVSGGNAQDWLVTPQFTPTAAANILTFKQRQTFSASFGTTYTIRVSTTSQTTHADFTIVDTQAESDFGTAYSTRNVNLSAYNGMPIYVAFVMEQDNGDSWYIDDVNLIPDANAPNCATGPTPADGATGVTVSSDRVLTISWTAPATGDAATEYEIFWGTTSGSLSSLGVFSATTVNITNIAYSTTYYWMVVPQNVGGSATGCPEWSFTTEAAPPPPSNYDCSNATSVTVNADLMCGSVVSGTLVEATASGVSDNGAGTPNDDVWYSFTATNAIHRIELQNVAGNTTDLVHEVLEGTCGSLTSLNISDPDTSTVAGLTVGNSYYLRLFSYGTTTNRNTTFDVCIGTIPAAPANDTFAGAIPITPSAAGTGCATPTFTLNFSTDGTTDSGMDGTCNTTSTGLDQFFTWTATTNGLLWNDASPGNPGIIVREASSGNEISCSETFASNDAVLSGWNVGDNLVIQIYDFTTSISDVAFCLEEYTLPSPPANDDCSNAVSITVNADLVCGNTISNGTIAGATASSDSDNGTGTPNDDVWYSFTATNAIHRIELQNVAGNTTDLVHEVLEGTCGSLTSLNISDPDTSTVAGLTIGNTYYLRVFSFGSTGGRNTTFDICIGTHPPPPSNDSCDNATVVNALPYNDTGDGTNATNNNGFISVCSLGMNDGVWYTFTTGNAGTVDIAITGVTGWDPELAIYSGSCGTFTCVSSADVGGSGSGETLSGVTVAAGTQYWINVGQFSNSADGAEGPFTISITTSDTTTLSLEDNKIEGFTLFPTIVKQDLNFNALENVEELSVYNLLGQQVFSSRPNATNASVDLSTLKAGMYLVKVNVGNAQGTYKIVKE